MRVDTNTIIEKIASKEIKVCMSEAALLMEFSANKEDARAATLTFITLSRFGSVYDKLMSSGESRSKGLFEKTEQESLKDKIYSSGVYYFGPMFKEHGGPLKDRQFILDKLSSAGYSTRCLTKLTDTQLDMFFTRASESGLISFE